MTETEVSTASPLVEPEGGVPPVIDDPAALEAVLHELRAGSGPVAVDVERASGYRYGQRAYLVQLRRPPSTVVLIDPTGFDDLVALGEALAGTEWVLHAASQDLPSLRELGMRPDRLFDTELGGRLAGFERVGLGAMVERLLGRTLAKEHSAADWSRRPLPEDWLRYAALDVEVLIELRDEVAAELERQGKTQWAAEEFEAVRTAPPTPPRVDPWRRTSGLHRVRTRPQLAVVRALWQARDEIARQRDTAPGRVLPDSAITAAALGAPADPVALARIPGWGGRSTRRLAVELWPVIQNALALTEADLPRPGKPGDGPPPANRWRDRDPEAAARLAAARTGLADLADAHHVPVENLLTPDLLRRTAWQPPAVGLPAMREALSAARPWQLELVAPVLVDAFERATTAPGPDDEPDPEPAEGDPAAG